MLVAVAYAYIATLISEHIKTQQQWPHAGRAGCLNLSRHVCTLRAHTYIHTHVEHAHAPISLCCRARQRSVELLAFAQSKEGTRPLHVAALSCA